jgi:hypothetical protein
MGGDTGVPVRCGVCGVFGVEGIGGREDVGGGEVEEDEMDLLTDETEGLR